MENLVNFKNIYQGKRVLVTGHTGFKGSWLSIWLHKLGAEVVGVALDPIHEKDNFVLSGISEKIKDIRADIRDKEKLVEIFEQEKPEIVFHLAAQPLVIDGYQNPIYTFETNVMGTANVLECIRKSKTIHTAVFITTDKVYDNKEQLTPYKEEDALGGYDPYSASKGASEIVIASYRNSFFNPNAYQEHKKSIASVRAGNVIGGGDWAANRIVPDCITAIENDEVIEVRNPKSIRPWQHVLEPLFGYLLLGQKMMEDPIKYAEAYNFGPENNTIIDVGTLVTKMIEVFEKGSWKDLSNSDTFHEAKLLTLNIDKAKNKLQWEPKLDFSQTIAFTVEWYKNYATQNVYDICVQQIDEYSKQINS